MAKIETPSNKAFVRAERPETLHPLMRDIHEVWLKSGMPLADIARDIGISPSTIYAWFMDRGVPDLRKMDDMLNLLGYRLVLQRGTRRANGAR